MTSYDFGYPWWLSYGHLVPALIFGALTALGLWRRWPRWLAGISAAITLWALGGLFIMHVAMRIGSPLALPTERFLAGGEGRVLDAGAGSGRSSLMVLLARPRARVTALDLYAGYYGIEDNTPARLLRNAKAAGVESRLDVTTGDMRQMPFADATFDGAVSTYAIDHLDNRSMGKALSEVARVLKPGGELLLMVINGDAWLTTAFPIPHHHSYFTTAEGAATWRRRLEAAGFAVLEHGTTPGTLYLVGTKTER